MAPERDSILLNRATAHVRLQDLPAALSDLELALKLDPNSHTARRMAAALYFRQGHDAPAAAHYRMLLQTDAEDLETIGALAWILATSVDSSVRDGNEAVKFATAWCERTGMQDPKALNALAAAQAEIGNFETGH